MTNQRNRYSLGTVARVVIATVIITIPPIIFEKWTFYQYTLGNPDFFTFSGSRTWFDIIWFVVSGVISVTIVGSDKKVSILPPLFASLLFVITAYVSPFCVAKECYVSSPDGFTPVRDFFLLGSLGVVASAASMKEWFQPGFKKWFDVPFQLGVAASLGVALSFYPIIHIFVGVSIAYPFNYVQWFLAAAPAGLAGSMLILDRGNLGNWSKVLAGILGVVVLLVLSINLPCQDCSNYPVSVGSILLVTILFTIPSILLSRRIARFRERSLPIPKLYQRLPGRMVITSVVLGLVIMSVFHFVPGYQASVVNSLVGVTNSNFSQLEVGRTFVYSAGYLAIPRVTSKAVGVNVSFGNTTISGFPNDFLAAGVGDQSPNCCTDGIDLAYRADAVLFSNGTEAVLGRGWWACDDNMACGGYSWQRLLHVGLKDLPRDALSNWVGLEMNWTSSNSIEWFYRITYSVDHTSTPWMLYDSFTPPKIQNHYWDAGLLNVAPGNLPTGFAYFYQFGVSSAYPISAGSWHVLMQCPDILLNGSWMCVPKAGFINGLHSFWKVIYTFGASYTGTNFSYLGNYKVEFFYSGKSPPDGTPIW